MIIDSAHSDRDSVESAVNNQCITEMWTMHSG